MDRIYAATLVAAPLKVAECRIIAGLLLENVSEAQWREAIVTENVLQKRSPGTARRFADYLRHRLLLVGPPVWQLIHDGSTIVSTQATFAAALKQSRLLADFIEIVVTDHVLQYKRAITPQDWSDFMVGCAARDPHVTDWTPGVVDKLRQNTFKILAEAGFIESTKTLTLQHVSVASPVSKCLEEAGETRILRLMQVMS